MTIVVGVAAPDGIVLAADSRATTMYAEAGHHRVASDSAQKVFPVSGRVAVATYGSAFLDGDTIAGLMDQFSAQLDEEAGVDCELIANELAAFFDAKTREIWEDAEELAANGNYPLGFLVAGYDADGIGRIREVAVPGPFVAPAADSISTRTLGIMWRGQTDVVRRLLEGVDWDAMAADPPIVVPEEAREQLKEISYNLLYPITLQDAVDLSTFLIRTTIDMQRFSDGTVRRQGDIPGCGGPIRVLAVTRTSVDWVAEPPTPLAVGDAGVAEAALERRR